jgi:hypothetical protein
MLCNTCEKIIQGDGFQITNQVPYNTGNVPQHESIVCFLDAVAQKCKVCWGAYRLLNDQEKNELQQLKPYIDVISNFTPSAMNLDSPPWPWASTHATYIHWEVRQMETPQQCPKVRLGVRLTPVNRFWYDFERPTHDSIPQPDSRAWYWLSRIDKAFAQRLTTFIPMGCKLALQLNSFRCRFLS